MTEKSECTKHPISQTSTHLKVSGPATGKVPRKAIQTGKLGRAVARDQTELSDTIAGKACGH